MLTFFCLMGGSAWAQTFTQGNLKYTVTDATAKTVAVAKANNDLSGSLVLPSNVTNEGVTYTVTSVSQSGFDAVAITSLTIPSTMVSLDTWAFSNCGSLATITIQEAEEPLSIRCGYYAAFRGSDADKVVTINRNLTIYDGNTPFPNTTRVKFGDKVTTICDNLFNNASKLASVQMGSGITSIGNGAFYGAGGDEGVDRMVVVMGGNVKTIGPNAFEYCSRLKSVTLPSTLKVVGNNAFANTGLTGVTIPASVDSLAYWAFAGNNDLTSFVIADCDNELKFTSGYYGTFSGCNSDKTIYIGRNLTPSEDTAPFANAISVTFGDKVTTINPNLFYNANKLAKVVIGKGVTSINSSAFYSIGDDESVDELVVSLGTNVTFIGPNAFEYCSRLKSVTLPSILKVVGNNAFANTGLTEVTIPASVDSLAYWAFAGNNDLTSFVIADCDHDLKFTSGYYGTFAGGNSDKTIYIGRDMTPSENTAPFANATSVEFGDNVTKINPNLFNGAHKLASVKMGSGITEIGDQAFYDSGDGETVPEMSVTMGENVKTIGTSAFNGCDSLKSIALPSTLKTIYGYAFQSTGLTSITIPASVDSIAERGFGACSNLASIRIEDKAEPLKMWNGHYGTFAYSDSEKTVYMGRDLELSDENGTPFGSNTTSVEFGDLVTAINPNLFNGAHKLASVKMGSGITEIGDQAFYDSGDGETVPEMFVTMGENVKTIGTSAFNSCDSLKSITLPEKLDTIFGWAFASTGLTDITIPVSVDSIGDRVFGACPSLASIRIEDSAKPLILRNGFYGTFAYSGADKTIYIGRDLVLNENDVLNYASQGNTTNVEFGDLVTAINPNLFNGAHKLASVKMGSGITEIGDQAFYDSGDGETVPEMIVTMGKNVKTIGTSAFNGCDSLKSITLPSTLKTIYGYAFQSSGLTGITIPASVDSIGDRAFGSCGNMTSINIENSTKTLKIMTGYYGTFAYSDAEKDIYVGRNLWLSENNAPFGNPKTVTFGEPVTSLPNIWFGNAVLTKVTVPWQTPLTIAANAFNDATYMSATLRIPGGTLQAYKAATGWKKFSNMEESSFFVTGTATTGGTLTFAGETVTNGSKTMLIDRETDVTFQVKAEENYDFTSLTVNGTAVNVANGIYTYPNLQSNIDVVATFTEKPKFDIKATATGGTVSLNGANFSASQNIKVYRDTDVTLTIAANEGYENPKVTVNGQDVTAQLQNNTLKLENIQEAKTIVVTYSKMKFQIAKQTTQNGSITLSKTVVEWGDSFTATFRPATGYELATATLNNQDVTAQVANNVLTVTDVKENKTVGATFQKQTYTVSISGGGVSVSNMNPQYGDNVTVTIDDDPDRTLVSLLVNGQDVTAQVVGGQYIIRNVTGNVTIEATFRSTKEFITMTGDYATFSCPQDLNFTGSELRAYIASGFNKNTNQVLMTRVYDVPAGTGIFLVGEPGETYKIPYSETGSIYMNFFQANLQRSTISATTGNYSNYIFGEQDGEPGFYPIDGRATLLAQTAYLQLPSSFVAAGVKVNVIFEDDIIDGIEDFRISDSDETIYDLAGRRLGKTQKGINIVNGKKVVFK